MRKTANIIADIKDSKQESRYFEKRYGPLTTVCGEQLKVNMFMANLLYREPIYVQWPAKSYNRNLRINIRALRSMC